ncbi:hypothetical protein [Salibacterium lacus]|uniref:Uncharacterized protein n=1 Tax=Salibacterium lacus TaxID=1898109 RepID=A0ABW5T1G9_9BACI
MMIVNKTFSFWAFLTSVLGVVFFILSHAAAPRVPQGFIAILTAFLYILAVILLLVGLISAVTAVIRKEPKKIKYAGVVIPFLIILYYILVPVIMALLWGMSDSP